MRGWAAKQQCITENKSTTLVKKEIVAMAMVNTNKYTVMVCDIQVTNTNSYRISLVI